jgi:hypothetical protein
MFRFIQPNDNGDTNMKAKKNTVSRKPVPASKATKTGERVLAVAKPVKAPKKPKPESTFTHTGLVPIFGTLKKNPVDVIDDC